MHRTSPERRARIELYKVTDVIDEQQPQRLPKIDPYIAIALLIKRTGQRSSSAHPSNVHHATGHEKASYSTAE